MIGLFPAAGRATRLGLPADRSKEVLEIAPGRRAADCLLEAWARARLSAAVVLHRREKTDIEAHYRAHPIEGLPIRYHAVDPTPSTLHTLAEALKVIPRESVALGFPDIQFNAPDAFVELRRTLESGTADIVLGCFPADRPDKVDMVHIAADGAVDDIVIKPAQTPLSHSWVLAVWRPRFSAWLQENLDALQAQHSGELYVGHALQALMAQGWQIDAVRFDQARLLDIGTPEDLERAAGFF